MAVGPGPTLLDRSSADDMRNELGWLGRALGPVRDADVLIERLRDRAVGFGDSGRDAVETPLPAGSGSTRSAALVELVRAEYHRLSKAVQAAGQDPPDEILHALRTRVNGCATPGSSPPQVLSRYANWSGQRWRCKTC
jgi:CHAD domain-containing protein